MAILIKGMEIPKGCSDCKLKSCGYCDITNRLVPYDGSRHEACPLVEVAEVQDAVSRQAAIDEFDKGAWDKVLAKAMIGSLPSAQPEIVRCKDCKFWREHKYAKETKRYIPFCGLNAIYTKSDDFCSKGARRTDE